MNEPEVQTAGSTEAPLYIRWGADRSRLAVELRLDLVHQIRAEIDHAENDGIEIGGVLVGSLPTAYSSTVRVEDVEIIPRSPQDGATFMLDPGQHDRFAEVRWRSRAREKTAVGMFRSHVRPGKLRPSLADRTLLSGEFAGPVYALLLVNAKQPHQAAFFLAAHGQLPVEPSVGEFKWEENDFRGLPEVDPESPVSLPAAPVPIKSRRRGWRVAAVAMVALAVAVAALVLFSRGLMPLNFSLAGLIGESQQLQLEAKPSNDQLQISWNRFAHELDSATGGTLRIRKGTETREIKIGADELHLGTVVLENHSAAVEVTLALDVPGSSPTSQTVYWQRR